MVEGKALVHDRAPAQDRPHLRRVRRGLRRDLRQARAEARPARSELPTPRELVAHLDDYVIGQDRVKKILAVAVLNHYKRLMAERGRRPRRSRTSRSTRATSC